MAPYDFAAQRLYVSDDLADGVNIACNTSQTDYFLNVLRLKSGSAILVFNGRDGEWRAELNQVKPNDCTLTMLQQVRPQASGPDIHYLFAPLKRARLDYMVQKATEMGVAVLRPVITQRTNVDRVNLERMRVNAIEAAEQCGILRIPMVEDPVKLGPMLESWDPARALIYCDEAASRCAPVETLAGVTVGPIGVLVGPEGGFGAEEQDMLRRQSFVVRLSLGPRVLRADTAAVAVLALVNAVLGDWQSR